MSDVLIAAVAVLGLVVGSFLNVVIFRLASGEAVVFGRSHCVQCGSMLRARDLIPVVSFLLLRGKCHSCGIKISWQYPLVELVTALLFVGLYLWVERNFGFIEGVFYGFLSIPFPFPWGDWSFYAVAFVLLLTHACLLLVLFVSDLKRQIIPNKVLWPGIVLATISLPFYAPPFDIRIYDLLLGAAVAGGFFLLLHVVSKGKWIGFGDVKLGVYLGLLIGFPRILVALMFAFISGAVIGVALIRLGKAKWGGKVPFGPFLIVGTVFAWLYGERIVGWYLNLLA